RFHRASASYPPTETSMSTATWVGAARVPSPISVPTGGRIRTTSAVASRHGRTPGSPSSTDGPPSADCERRRTDGGAVAPDRDRVVAGRERPARGGERDERVARCI